MGKNSIARFQKKLKEYDVESWKCFNIMLVGLPVYVKKYRTAEDSKEVFEWYKKRYLEVTLNLGNLTIDDWDLREFLKKETHSEICNKLLRDSIFSDVLRSMVDMEINPKPFIQVVTSISRKDKENFLISHTRSAEILQSFKNMEGMSLLQSIEELVSKLSEERRPPSLEKVKILTENLVGLVQEPKTLKKIMKNEELAEVILKLLQEEAFPEFLVDIMGEVSRKNHIIKTEVNDYESKASENREKEDFEMIEPKNSELILAKPENEGNKQELSRFLEDLSKGDIPMASGMFILDFSIYDQRVRESDSNYTLANEIIKFHLPIPTKMIEERAKIEYFIKIYSKFYKAQAKIILNKMNANFRDYYYTVKKFTYENNFQRVLFNLLNHNLDISNFIAAVARDSDKTFESNVVEQEVIKIWKELTLTEVDKYEGAYEAVMDTLCLRYKYIEKLYSDAGALKLELLRIYKNQEIVEAIFRDKFLVEFLMMLYNKGISPEIIIGKVAETDLNKLKFEKCSSVNNGNSGRQKPVICLFCKKNNHSIENCWNLKKESARLRNESFKICYYCKKPGHFLRDCEKLRFQKNKSEERTKYEMLENFLRG